MPETTPLSGPSHSRDVIGTDVDFFLVADCVGSPSKSGHSDSELIKHARAREILRTEQIVQA
eukprot:scaffold280352_cov40-Prasinocladus_malaysianus.AAC.1